MRACKVICTYFGVRRGIHNTPTTSASMLELFKQSIEFERTVDAGVPMDTIIVNNEAGFEEGDEYLQSLRGSDTKNGRFLVYNRFNVGGGFGAFSDVFHQHKADYDYWLFCEDDILIFRDGYYADAIAQMTANPKAGFIAFSPISHTAPFHCGGGFGISSREALEKVAAHNNGFLPVAAHNNYGSFEQTEIRFTSIFAEIGYDLMPFEKYSPLAQNYQAHAGQMGYVSEHNLGREHFYRVGN